MAAWAGFPLGLTSTQYLMVIPPARDPQSRKVATGWACHQLSGVSLQGALGRDGIFILRQQRGT